MRVAIVGAGMAGLACARALTDADANVQVRLFDKGRGPGGRMSARRATVGGDTLRFDHGAQYFTARDPAFRSLVDEWKAASVVARWPVAGDDAFVGTPAMNAPIRALAADHDVRFACRIDRAERREGKWTLLSGESEETGPYDALIVAIPAEQAAPLLASHDDEMASAARATVSDPCWTVMVRFTEPLDRPDTLCDAGAIGWAARDSAKPGRDGRECWVIQAGPDWSRAHLEDDADTVATALLDAFSAAGRDLPPHDHLAAHRWRYARSGSAGRDFLWNGDLRLGACGDWLLGPRVENAFLSGARLGARIRSERT
ncbi:NAD(P)-binding protein [Sphingomicrobium sp. XHP0239]|uniref:NAD(P)/FAD-dependent oxidoreductase n=1 Tax=Sphingomicrobium maritimum TaxID=3133972 RepID=UPI0031CCB162